MASDTEMMKKYTLQARIKTIYVRLIVAVERQTNANVAGKKRSVVRILAESQPYPVSKILQIPPDCSWTTGNPTILSEKNTLFESLVGKLTNYPDLNGMIRSLLFIGKSIVCNTDNTAIDNATMFGFIRNQCGTVAIANRIFEMRLYNLYLFQYLEDYHQNKGYMVSFNFNKQKQTGLHEIVAGNRILIEAVV